VPRDHGCRPLRYALLFERFLNPGRVSMPDIDIDFCGNRREEVIEYVRQKYGDDCVSQIITFGTMASRGVLRDVGRVLDCRSPTSTSCRKKVPQGPGASLETALERTRAQTDPRQFAAAQTPVRPVAEARGHGAPQLDPRRRRRDRRPAAARLRAACAKNGDVITQWQMTELEESAC
jgi:DNA polymerase-3 subunit alpha